MSKTVSRTCRDKTAVGNVYNTVQRAEYAAASMSEKVGKPIHSYLCSVCSLWHIGGDNWARLREKHVAKRAENRRREEQFMRDLQSMCEFRRNLARKRNGYV